MANNIEEILSLVPTETKLHKNNSVVFKLRVTPASPDSPTYELTVPIVSGSEGTRAAVNFRRGVKTILTGMNATNADSQHAIIQRMLKDNALQAYLANAEKSQSEHHLALRERARANAIANGQDAAAQQAAWDAVNLPNLCTDDITYGINAVVQYMVPYKVLPRVKRWMRRKCRKQADMTIREFYNHFSRINEEEIPHLPPDFNHSQKLSDDEIIDIILFAIPNSWNRELDRQGKEPETMSQIELINFLEQLEASETHDAKSEKNQKKDSGKKGQKKQKTSSSNDSGDSKYCMYHGKNNTHNTEKCKVIQGLAESKKNKDDGNQGGSHKNKTWNRKKDDAKKKEKNELKSFIADSIKTGIRDEMSSIRSSKKRKSEDSSDEESINLAEMDFDNFNIGEDGEVSV